MDEETNNNPETTPAPQPEPALEVEIVSNNVVEEKTPPIEQVDVSDHKTENILEEIPSNQNQEQPAEIKSEVVIKPPANNPETVTIFEQVTPEPDKRDGIIKNLLERARSVSQSRKTKKLEKIMARVSQNGKISNNEVARMLRVTNMSAFRYLDLLEKQGEIKQVGKTGRGVFYQKV